MLQRFGAVYWLCHFICTDKMLVLFAALTLGSPVHPPWGDAAQTQCRMLTLVQRETGAAQECCKSCSDGYLLHNTWLIDRVEVTEVENGFERANENAVTEGSGVLMSEWSEKTSAEELTATYMAERHAACGSCVTSTQCMRDLKGSVNTWHRLCITRP